MASINDIEVGPSPLGGQGLFAKISINPGEPILSLERPLVATLDKQRIEDTCSWCFAWTELPVLSGTGINQANKVNWCTGCKRVRYCSKKCQSQAWKAVHKRECKIFAAAPEMIPNTVVAVMQMMQGIDGGDARSQEILKMESHRDDFEKAGGQKWEAMQLMAHTALKFLGEKEGTAKLQTIRLAMCIVMCNSARLVTPTFDSLGMFLEPLTSRMNHSCSPNAIVVFDGPRVTVRALQKVNKGDEIFISYIDNTSPYAVRQAELQDQYFFTCTCPKCKQGAKAPSDAFLKPGPEFESRIGVIDEMLPQLKTDPAWPRHIQGESTHDLRLSALQFYAYSFLSLPSAAAVADTATVAANSEDPSRFRKAITICRNSGVFPLSRAPLPALYQEYAVACLASRRYNEALIALLRVHFVIDPEIYPQKFHPVRIVHTWTLATLARAVGAEPDSPFCQALQSCGVDLSLLFIGLLVEVHENVGKSHGEASMFGRAIEETWRVMMQPGGDMDEQFAGQGVPRERWQAMFPGLVGELMPKVKKFAEDEGVAAQMDEAMAG